MKRRSQCALAALALALAPAAPLGAQDGAGHWFVPLDLGQGFVLDAGEPTPYVFSARLAAQLGLGSGGAFRVGPAGAVLYANPDWEVAGGARASLRLMQIGLSHWGLFVNGEQLWSSEGRTPASVSLVLNAGLVRAGGWVVRDWESKDTSLEFSLGTDLSVLLPFLSPKEDPDPFTFTPVPAPERPKEGA
jgi:hypothetical protein